MRQTSASYRSSSPSANLYSGGEGDGQSRRYVHITSKGQDRRGLLFLAATTTLLILAVASKLAVGREEHDVEGHSLRCKAIAEPDVEALDLRSCRLKELPPHVLSYTSLKKLDLSGNMLSDLPSFVAPYSAGRRHRAEEGDGKEREEAAEKRKGGDQFKGDEDHVLLPNLEILFLSENVFDVIPKSLQALPKLRILAMKHNNLSGELSSSALPWHSLEWLILTGNRIREISKDIGRLVHLRKLMLSHNQISSVPSEMSQLTSLEMIRIANNRLSMVPPSLALLPKLAWIAMANNAIPINKSSSLPPLSSPPPPPPPPSSRHLHDPQHLLKHDDDSASLLPRIAKAKLEIDEVVGAGSGGCTYRATYLGKTIGVKIWNDGGKFSDGSPENEIRNHELLHHHPNIAGATGVLAPPHKGLILRWLENAVSFAGPPSFDSVVRDTLPPDDRVPTSYEEGAIVQAACDMANVAFCSLAAVVKTGNRSALGHRSGLRARDLFCQDVSRSSVCEDVCHRRIFSFETAVRRLLLLFVVVCCCLLTVLQALRYVHSKGIAHGDIYLHNTIEADAHRRQNQQNLERVEKKVYLSDFGAAFSYDTRAHPWIEHVEVVAFGYLLLDLSGFAVRLGLLPPHSSSRRVLEKIGTLCVRNREKDTAYLNALARNNKGEVSSALKEGGLDGGTGDRSRVITPLSHNNRSSASSSMTFADVAEMLRAAVDDDDERQKKLKMINALHYNDTHSED